MGKHNNNIRLIKRSEEVGFVDSKNLDHANHSPVYPQRLSKEERLQNETHLPPTSRIQNKRGKNKNKGEKANKSNTYEMRYKN